LNAKKEGRIRFVFEQEIYKKPTNTLVLKALFFVAFSTNGKPVKAPVKFLQAIEGSTPSFV
jgi:acyl-CoA thioesterase FadM